MKMTKSVEVLLIDKQHLLKQMKDLPGLDGVKAKEEKHLPGLDGVEEAYRNGYLKGYEEGLQEAYKHDDDDDGDADKEKMKKNKPVLKMIRSLVKKMFSQIGYDKISASPLYSEANGVSVITIDGELGKRLSDSDRMNGKVDVDDITDALRIAEKANTSAVVLHINSPGGVSTGIQETGDVIKQLSKPTFTFCDTVCASAAYWLASCTQGIFVTPTSELGSIGVLVKVMDYSNALKQSGINPQVFSAGEYKTMGHGEQPLTDKEQDFILNDIEKQYVKFKMLVSEYRGGVADENMQGQLFSGEEAVGINLADEVVADFETLLNYLTE